ncbi:MAG: YebC/PmpR family DNA-binding transcriptional regulator [Myxococcales bacterium FL481]|nr:MAG: YebC/PmpR family DNA-binding transcriptional regulator [Myxococcales bacterium FL481]
MSGHSKWSTIKRKKGAVDAARGKVFTKIAREIQVATREGGGDADANPRLRAALMAAKAANMPKDNQERAIKKGLGATEGADFAAALYEGRGPSGVAFVIEVLTDNKNRTVAELRHKFVKAGGELGSDGSATWMFDHTAVFVIDRGRVGEDALMEATMEAGGDDVVADDDSWVVSCPASAFGAVADALAGFEPESAELRWVVKPENATSLTGEAAVAVAKLWAGLDDLDDVQTCYCSATLPDSVLEEHGP